MLNAALANELVTVASQQLSEGLRAKQERMKVVSEILDLYNNKTLEIDENVMNIPFPVLAGQIDLLYSKIDNPPSLTFKIPNKALLSDKIQAAWMQEMSSTRAGWNRKDRAEKKMALLTGRGVAKVYASSVGNQYRSHYELVDVFSFVADPTRGFLEDGNYHGETDIFKTHSALKLGVQAGVYSAAQVQKLIARQDTEKDGDNLVVQHKFDRLKAMGVDVQSTSFAGQKGVNMTEWVMRYDGEWYYLLFEPTTSTWVRAEKLKDVFENGKTHFVSWATHYDEYAFWTKGAADDVYPLAEAMRFLLNNALENEKRRNRPMRIVDSGALLDVNELQDYIPDNVIIANPGKNPNIVTLETPETSATINIVEFLDTMIQNKSGVADAGIEENDPKVGVFYGKLQQEADRIGTINKEYSESYAHKGYRFFWGLKQHLTQNKQIEMLGKGGIKLQELGKADFKDVDDVDDVVVAGGSKEAETTAIEAERKLKTLSELTAVYGDKLNPTWVIRTNLKMAGYEDDDIEEALDVESSINRELIEEADQAIQSVLLGTTPNLNMQADTTYLDRIITYVNDNLNYVKLDKKGNEIGIDEKIKKQSDLLLAFVKAHEKIVLGNMARKQRKQEIAMMSAVPQEEGAQEAVNVEGPSQTEQRAALAQPFEKPMGSPAATASASQAISSRLGA
jgi:hypothetical protein